MTGSGSNFTSATALRVLRSRLFSLFVVVLVLVGYSEILHASCSHHSVTVVEGCEGSDCSHSESDLNHEDGEDCCCICHSSFVNEQAVARWVPTLLPLLSLVSERADHPPDSVPLGIDYPPQLA